jgi:serine kinase of HPr protein (carbohydrate metabolism regulator)
MTVVHASCVAIHGEGVLLSGTSGSGKSDLALRLIDRGAQLVSDDYTALSTHDGALHAAPPPRLAGLIEVRGVGLVRMDFIAPVPVALFVALDTIPERLPVAKTKSLLGIEIPKFELFALEPSAPIKLELILARLLGSHRA